MFLVFFDAFFIFIIEFYSCGFVGGRNDNSERSPDCLYLLVGLIVEGFAFKISNSSS